MNGDGVTDAAAVNATAGAGPRRSVLHAPEPMPGGFRPRAATDAVRACTLTLVALVAWVITPPLTVLLLSTIGLVGVVRAHREGRVDGHCSLGRPKLIVGYLSIAWGLGAWFTVAGLADLVA